VSARKGYADPRGKTPEERDRDERAKLARDAKMARPTTHRRAEGAAEQSDAASRRDDGRAGRAVQEHGERNVGGRQHRNGCHAFSLRAADHGTVFADKVELSYFPLDEQGKGQHGMRNEIELTLRPDTYQRVRQVGLRLNPRIALAPGRYQLRIGVRELGAGLLGTVFYDLVVPDFAKDPVANERGAADGGHVTAGSDGGGR